MTADDLCWMPARRLAAGIAGGDFSAVEVLDAHLAQIAAVNPAVNAIVTLDPDRARVGARAADGAVARGEQLGPLHGLPIAVKDLEDTAGMRTTYGSPIFADQVPERDSLLVERLRRAGAIVVGKTNTPELGPGRRPSTKSLGRPATPTSSRSRRVAAAAGRRLRSRRACCRSPTARTWRPACATRPPSATSSACGPHPGGFRPRGLAAIPGSRFQSSARSPAASMMRLFFSGPWPARIRATRCRSRRGRRAGADHGGRPWPGEDRLERRFGGLPIEPAIAEVLSAARDRLTETGVEIRAAEPDLRPADEGFEIMRAVGFAQFGTPLLDAHPDRLKDTVVWNIRRGHALTAADVGRARVLHEQVFRAMREFLLEFDVLAAPVTQVAPFPVDLDWPRTIDGQPMEDYIAWMRSCSRITFTGHPAISVSAGFTRDGLPVGVQLVGRFRSEWTLLRAAAMVAEALGAAGRRPPLHVRASGQGDPAPTQRSTK